MGLGSLLTTSLAEAREAADIARRQVARGVDPIDARRKSRTGGVTFGDVADQLIGTLRAEWKNEKHVGQWLHSLTTDAALLRSMEIDKITTQDILAVLTPIWSTKPETASRCRGRIERVLDAAKVQGLRIGDNPARWKGHLAVLLPKRQKLTRGHHPAMPFELLPDFMRQLRGRPALAARALELTILTAARTGEVIGARWSEFDMDRRIWTVPASRMKAKVEHRVPLSIPASALLSALIEERRALGAKGEFVFAQAGADSPISNMAMNMLLRRMGEHVATVHGFRSAFRDWAGERTEHPREVTEAALAHRVGNEVEQAYRRGDALEKRRLLMEEWAFFCSECSMRLSQGRTTPSPPEASLRGGGV